MKNESKEPIIETNKAQAKFATQKETQALLAKYPMEDQDSDSETPSSHRRIIFGRALHDPTINNALVLYTPPALTELEKTNTEKIKSRVHVVVDPIIGNVLRPHQREGVKFMYDCVTGAKSEYCGCIMADEMGLGKTLQCITLVWTLLRQGPDRTPTIAKAIIVCPSTLVKNWDNEFIKWLGNRIHCLAIANESKEKTTVLLRNFVANKNSRCGASVLIISYETFRLYSHILNASEVGLLLCDEGHRLKNCDNLTYLSLTALQTKRRVLLSGTPIQNDLMEYYSLLNFVNPGMLGTPIDFRRQFENSILRGRDSCSTNKEREKGSERLKELTQMAEKCMIRRTSALLTKYLPVKFEMVVCVKLTQLQIDLYKNFLKSDMVRKSLNEGKKANANALASITTLKKLCNHPELVAEKINEESEGFENAGRYLPKNWGNRDVQPELGGKFLLLDIMLAAIKRNTTDKLVIISNYTQTLDFMEKLSRKRGYGFVRLDGSMGIKKRGKIVEEFNKPASDCFIFLLSSKAGGCGLNLIGANRLIMFDPDWNPANDEQAMARVWRDGQKKPCYIYRFITTGTIEEKIFQRQTHKKALSNSVVDNDDPERHFSVKKLKELFKLEENTLSDTHDIFKCKRCVNNIQVTLPPENSNCTCDLSQWYHASNNKGIPDDILLNAWNSSKNVSFVFHHQSAKKDVEPEPSLTPPQNRTQIGNYSQHKIYSRALKYIIGVQEDIFTYDQRNTADFHNIVHTYASNYLYAQSTVQNPKENAALKRRVILQELIMNLTQTQFEHLKIFKTPQPATNPSSIKGIAQIQMKLQAKLSTRGISQFNDTYTQSNPKRTKLDETLGAKLTVSSLKSYEYKEDRNSTALGTKTFAQFMHLKPDDGHMYGLSQSKMQSMRNEVLSYSY